MEKDKGRKETSTLLNTVYRKKKKRKKRTNIFLGI